MSNELMLPPGGKKVPAIEAPLHFYAGVLDTGGWIDKARGCAINGHRLPLMDWTSRSLANATAENRSAGIKDAKIVRQLLLPIAAQIDDAIQAYTGIIDPVEEDFVSPAQATMMIRALFEAIAGERRTEEDYQTKLDACLMMFDPVIGSIGAATQLWGEVPRHPLILALGMVRMLLQTQTFVPAPLELAQACRRARGRLREQLRHMQDFLDRLCRAEEVFFDLERAAWIGSITSMRALDAARAAGARFYGSNEKWQAWSRALDEIEQNINTCRDP